MVNVLLYCLYSVVELSNILLCYTQILQIPICRKKATVVWIYVLMLSNTIANVYLSFSSADSINIIWEIIAVFVLFGKDKKTILLFPCAAMLASIINVAVSFAVASMLHSTQSTVSENMFLVVLVNSTFSIIAILLLILKKIRKKNTDRVYFNKFTYIAATINVVLFFLLIGLFQYTGGIYNIRDSIFNLLGLFVSLIAIVFFVVILWSANLTYQSEKLKSEKVMYEMYLQEQQRYSDLVTSKDADMRSFRHDIKEHLYILKKYIDNGEYKSAKHHIEMLNMDFVNAQMHRFTGIMAVDAIINEKKVNMENYEICFDIKTMSLQMPGSIDVYDICTILINILNNAIEACKNMEKEKRTITLSIATQGEHMYIMERNPIVGDIVFDSNDNPVSTKSNKHNHGFGSINIRKAVKKYGGELQYQVGGDFFSIEIIL